VHCELIQYGNGSQRSSCYWSSNSPEKDRVLEMSKPFFSHHIFLNINEDVLYNNGNITAYVGNFSICLGQAAQGRTVTKEQWNWPR